jgi:hypothetical protein
MTRIPLSARSGVLATRIAWVVLITLAVSPAAHGQGPFFKAGNLVVSRSVYANNPGNIAIGTILPPGCANTQGGCANPAMWDGTYPTVWNNVLNDASFGLTSKILLDQITQTGVLVNTLEVPNSSDSGITPGSDQMVTSFSSKSEIALNLSTSGNFLTFMGYLAPVGAIDLSNSNTVFLSPWSNVSTIDFTNPVGQYAFRVVAQVDQNGSFHFTKTNSYSGNNGRAAILNDASGANVVYMAGNAGNGANPQPNGIIVGAGAQILTPSTLPEIAQFPGAPEPLGSFNITQLGNAADKTGKDTNFRGLRVHNNVVYFTKGSGSNGINTVYFVDTTGTACPNGVGLPSPSAVLPTMPIAYSTATLQSLGVTPYNMCILKGFPTILAKNDTVDFPFGLFFADNNTLYVADEGNGDNTFSAASGIYTKAAAQTRAGLQKWVFNSNTGSWTLAYTLNAGLNLGVPYTVSGYPAGNNSATMLPWSPGTDGLRNITGIVQGGNVIVWGITSTVSGNGDQGADPNELVVITDSLANTNPAVAASETFATVRSAGNGEVLRGVAFAPGSALPPF